VPVNEGSKERSDRVSFDWMHEGGSQHEERKCDLLLLSGGMLKMVL